MSTGQFDPAVVFDHLRKAVFAPPSQEDAINDALTEVSMCINDLARERDAAISVLQEIAGDGKNYAPCLSHCIEGPPTCGCAEERAREALSR